ncbi:MAG: phage integrase N-terminal SAM-like domain-containing protein [Acidobacteria bacterium]|nr:phage integrase N-terminal SAM-like domain-containing protein [Acidobacteriota bacterium]
MGVPAMSQEELTEQGLRVERFFRKNPGALAEITQFLSWLAVTERVSASTQNQALSSLLFL